MQMVVVQSGQEGTAGTRDELGLRRRREVRPHRRHDTVLNPDIGHGSVDLDLTKEDGAHAARRRRGSWIGTAPPSCSTHQCAPRRNTSYEGRVGDAVSAATCSMETSRSNASSAAKASDAATAAATPPSASATAPADG